MHDVKSRPVRARAHARCSRILHTPGDHEGRGEDSVTIRTIRVGVDNVFVVREEGTILVDGGQPGMYPLLARGLRKAGVRPGGVGLIVLTHGHWDHIGCVAQAKALTGARLAMHPSERERMERSLKIMPPGRTAWGAVLGPVIAGALMSWARVEPATVDVPIPDEGMSLAPWGIDGQVVHTPGHSPGSVSVLLSGGDALVGDLAMNMFPLRLRPGLPIFAEDPTLLRASIGRLLSLGAKTIHPAHGGSFPATVLERALRTLPA